MIATSALVDSSRGVVPGVAKIERGQLAKLNTLWSTILPANRFYQQKLAGLEIHWPFPSLSEYAQTVPFTTKHEIIENQLAHPPYGTNLTYPLASYVRFHQTSGTTTTPMPWLDTAESWNHIVENWRQIFDAAAIAPSDRFFFAFSFGPFIGFWSALEAAARQDCFFIPGGAMNSQARLRTILNHNITVICCTPTYALHLGEVARESKADMSKSRVRLIIVAGEAGGSIASARSQIESLWPGALVFDHHGMTEVGPVSYQCPRLPGVLHILESAYLPEVINPHTGAPVQAGEIGELVLTTLDRLGSPLLRYRTGDLVKAKRRGICACGRQELACEGGILGRSDDMVIVRGVNVYPSMIDEVVRNYREITEYRVTLDRRGAMTEMSLEVEMAAAEASPELLRQQIQQALACALNFRVPVQVRSPGFLPRFEMKSQRWIKLG